MNGSVKAIARVQVTLQFDVGSSWGAEASVEQIYNQAREEALQALRYGVTIGDRGHEHAAEIIGPIDVRAMLLEEA